MIIEGEYFYKGAQRLSWGFGSPNQLGAFVASAIPLIWGLTASRPLIQKKPPVGKSLPANTAVWPSATRIFLWLCEFCLWLLVGATASRGSALAAISAAIVWSLEGFYFSRNTARDQVGWFALRLAMCVFGLSIFSFGGRIAPGFITHDDSIGNRFLLWNGASTLLAAAPWTGWGIGESGNAFMQWVQTLDRPEAYKTMVNSFLHVGVERGLPSLALLFFLTAIGSSWSFVWEQYVQSERMRVWVRASSCVFFSWALSNVFSTLFKEWKLWIFPGACCALLVISAFCTRHSARRWLVWTGSLGSAAIVACAVLFLVGTRNNAAHLIHLKRVAPDCILLGRKLGNESPRWAVLIDPVILGPRYGHEIRRWASQDPTLDADWGVAMIDRRFWQREAKRFNEINRWLLFGNTALEADELGSEKKILFINPRGQPPKNWNGRGAIVFSGVDEDGSREVWIQWATRKKIKMSTIALVGLDVRSAWPASYLPLLASMP